MVLEEGKTTAIQRKGHKEHGLETEETFLCWNIGQYRIDLESTSKYPLLEEPKNWLCFWSVLTYQNIQLVPVQRDFLSLHYYCTDFSEAWGTSTLVSCTSRWFIVQRFLGILEFSRIFSLIWDLLLPKLVVKLNTSLEVSNFQTFFPISYAIKQMAVLLHS